MNLPPPARPDDLSRLIEVLARQAEASTRLVELIESRSLPLLERIAEALERAPASPSGGDGRARSLVELALAIDEGRWARAAEVIESLAVSHPGDPEASDLAGRLERSRQVAVDGLLGRIEAAKQANDPDGAIRSRDELAAILRGDSLRAVDVSLVRWLLLAIQRRLRTGTVRPDVVELASRVAEGFGGTTEGASLRASLPTLRRSAGLCPRCAEPYKGVEDACPKCLAAAGPPPAPLSEPDTAAADLPESVEPEPGDEAIGEPVDLNDERFWQDP